MAEDIRTMESTAGNQAFERQFHSPYCVLLDSEYCSMGRMIGMLACERSGYQYYDGITLLELVPETGVTPADVNAFEAQLREKEMTGETVRALPNYQRIAAAFDLAIDLALSKGPCLIHDRATPEMVAARGYSCLRVLTYAVDMQDKLDRARLSPVYRGVTSDRELIRKIQEENRIRYNCHMAHSDTLWGQKETYDLCLNTDLLGRDYAAALLGNVMAGK